MTPDAQDRPPAELPGAATGIGRREAIRRVSAALGGVAFAAGTGFLAACDPRTRAAARAGGVGSFTPDDVALLDEIADTILPATDTPGAKTAECGAFMALMVTDTYDERDRQVFREGMAAVHAACQAAHGVDFMGATPEQRLAVLETLDREQVASPHADDAPPHYFRMMKQLAMLGYFTSEVGCTQAMRYIESPARFDPCAPYSAGERTWAPHA